MLNHFRASIAGFDASIERQLKLQCLDENNPYYGTILDIAKGYTEPSAGVGLASSLMNAYYHPYSKWYHNEMLLERAIVAIKNTLRRQNEDGTLDLMETNFHDPTFTAFCIHGAGPAYKLHLRDTQHTPLEDELSACFETFMRNAGDSMVNGGFHTPNHRWVVSAALSYCYNTLKDEKYLNHIKKFLNEGIDCDENGEFTERSAGTYNIICDRVLIMMAEELNMPELLDHVARNLRMVMTYIEPDETINTLNSTRQDFGTGYNFTGYYEPYLKMAVLTGDPEFAWLADYMQSKGAGCDMTWFLLHPGYEEKMLTVPTKKPDLNYEKHYVESGIMRQRIGDATLTLIKERPLFAKFQYKNKPLLIRFAGSFFGPHAQFKADTLEEVDGGYRLTYHKSWGYKRPLEEKPASPLWKDMDHSKRASVGMQDFDVAFTFKMTDGNLHIELDACTDPKSCDNIPCKLELMFPAGCLFENDSTALTTKDG
ncbi:MAG: hypothetical protein IJC25_07760, partial [Clostridia bacterium]|nr:hypothetical protein [Clostridia bacterium]